MRQNWKLNPCGTDMAYSLRRICYQISSHILLIHNIIIKVHASTPYCIQNYTHARIHACMHARTHTHTHPNICTRTRTCTHTHTRTRTRTRTHRHAHVNAQACTHACTHARTQTRTHALADTTTQSIIILQSQQGGKQTPPIMIPIPTPTSRATSTFSIPPVISN